MNNWNDRLKFALNTREVRPTDLAKAIGISRASVSDWLTGKTKVMAADHAMNTANFLSISMNWLLYGKGRSGLEATNALMQESAKYSVNFVEIPILNSTASMGIGNEFEENEIVIDSLKLSKDWAQKQFKNITSVDNLTFIHAFGDSMFPTFSDGDILLVDIGIKTAQIDGIYVLEANSRLYVKRVRQRIDSSYEISSDNPTVKTVDVLNGGHEVTIRGRVLWAWNGKRL